jgi:hypothetical protein
MIGKMVKRWIIILRIYGGAPHQKIIKIGAYHVITPVEKRIFLKAQIVESQYGKSK